MIIADRKVPIERQIANDFAESTIRVNGEHSDYENPDTRKRFTMQGAPLPVQILQ